MIYFENASYGKEGFNTHVMSFTLATALSNFLERDFYFDFEVPSSSPPEFAFDPAFREKFAVLLNSPRSLVSDLLVIPNRRVNSVDRGVKNKAEFQLLYSHFVTTEAVRDKFQGTIIWDSFGAGRFGHTREELNSFELIEWTHSKLTTPAFFFFLPRQQKRSLLETVKIRYLPEVEALADQIINDFGPYYAFHLRMGDFLRNYSADEYEVDVMRFREFASKTFENDELSVLAATDGLDSKDLIREMFPGRSLVFIDEFIFDEYGSRYGALPLTDFNVLTIVDQLVCAAATTFIGTYRSTFTAIIHRLRQERYARKDFNFFPDAKIRRMLSADMQLRPDRPGFFDWNRYSELAGDHAAMAWMREWDHDLSTLDL